MIYFDNAATSFPKPPEVADAMLRFMKEIGANPGRSGHRRSVEAARIVFDTREKVANLFGADDPLRVVFCQNATEAVNLSVIGLLRSGDHVITSSMEHNSVMRPLRRLESAGVELSVAQCSPQGLLDPDDIKKLIKKNTVMVVLNHASNVTGSIQPVAETGRIAREHGLLFLVDAAQTAGSVPIEMGADCIDLLAFTGHKHLYGPQGTGGLVFGSRMDIARLAPLKTGGTGSRSEYEYQPDFSPDKYESGTLNCPGIAGLNASLGFIGRQGMDAIRAHEISLTQRLISGLRDIKAISIYGCGTAELQTATVSFSIRHVSPSEAVLRLDEEFGIMCRPGLHCSPASHKTIGTFPEGTIRFGLSYFNTADEVDLALNALGNMANGAGK